jgi:catechol 2,3-dioxygenase-like lactoylglutathione lyase family enzyme
MKIEKIDHAHIMVKDLEKAMRFFSDILGSQFVGPIDKSDHLIAFDNVGLELLAPKTDEMPRFMKAVAPETKEGLYAIGFKAPNRDEAVSELESKGIRCLWKGDYPTIKTAQMNPIDTYGVWIELLEYKNTPPIAMSHMADIHQKIPFFEP